jgi:hypothetical protein
MNAGGNEGTSDEPTALSAEELIDDRALSGAGQDAFGLNDFVTELVAVCEQTTLPANVALFGAWGSGKSSLANLLEQRLQDGRHKAVAFARFDAFKYSGAALRRHLLSQLANAFGLDGKKYGEGLYRTRNTNSYELPAEDRWRFLKLLALAALAVAVVLVGAAVVVGLLSDTGKKGAFGPAFRGALEAGIPSLLFASGLIATILAITGQTFTVASTQAPPSTEEEFGRLFGDLVREVVAEKGCERIVIFVDELDRCSPGQVVAVLETIKTFLHIDPCVFVVAADKQAIEQALGEQARQATPEDVVNPYYSAGSAYLDKIFQHQLALPPLLPRTLSRFALELIADRPGAWSQIENKAELVTVLVAEHVRSPRRVKVLLNAFLLAYRLALRRAAHGALDSAVASRASEIAKLVCLQTEFPLFAAELRLDARIVAATLAIADEPGVTLQALELSGFTEEAYGRAKAYASGRLPVDTVIAGSQPSADEHEQSRASEFASRAEGDGVEVEDEQPDDAVSPDVADVAGIIESQSRQLTAYLARTRKITGPRRDLVFLESSGAAFDLPAELGETLEQSARNGIAAAVTAGIESLPRDQRPDAISLLCALARDSIGVETENICHCLLGTLGAMDGELDTVVDDVLVTLQVVSSGYELRPADLAGALAASLLRHSPAALDLREQVLERPETLSEEKLGLMVLSHAGDLAADERERIAPVLAARLLDSTPETVFEAAEALGDEALAEMTTAEQQSLIAGLAEVAEDEAAATLAALVRHAAEAHPHAAAALAAALLALDTKAARSEAESVLQILGPISDPSLIRQALGATALRTVSGWKRWIGALDAQAVRDLPDAAQALAPLAARIITRRFAADSPASAKDARSAIELLSGLLGEGMVLPADPVEQVFQGLSEAPPLNDEQGQLRLTLYQLTTELSHAGLLPARDAARLIIADTVATLNAPIVIGADTEQAARARPAGGEPRASSRR